MSLGIIIIRNKLPGKWVFLCSWNVLLFSSRSPHPPFAINCSFNYPKLHSSPYHRQRPFSNNIATPTMSIQSHSLFNVKTFALANRKVRIIADSLLGCGWLLWSVSSLMVVDSTIALVRIFCTYVPTYLPLKVIGYRGPWCTLPRNNDNYLITLLLCFVGPSLF